MLRNRPVLVLEDHFGVATLIQDALARDGWQVSMAGTVDRMVGLEAGANDVMTKPFSPREMAARIRALGRRLDSRPASEAPRQPPASVKLGDISAEPSRHRIVAADGRQVCLTAAEAIRGKAYRVTF